MVAPERMWTPWRMQYLSGKTRETGCVFCNRLASDNDLGSFILHRTSHNFVIMNLYPYGSGHIMIVPNQHAARPNELDQTTRHEMADLLPLLMDVLQRSLNCEGFNAGFNFGAAGGAGIAEHLHQHIVPRWSGDANFMPIIASTRVLPETLPVTYAKIRSELESSLVEAYRLSVVALVDDDRKVMLRDGTLPIVSTPGNSSIWRQAIESVSDALTEIEVAGWAGPIRSDVSSQGALVLRGRPIDSKTFRAVEISEALSRVNAEERSIVENGIRQLAPIA